MDLYLPSIALAGFVLGSAVWTALIRRIGKIALSREVQPVVGDDALRRVTGILFWIATPWILSLCLLAAWLYWTPGAARGWLWLCLGAASVPVFGIVIF